MVKIYSIVKHNGLKIVDLSSGIKERTKLPSNAVMVTSKKCISYFQDVIVERKGKFYKYFIPLTPVTEKTSFTQVRKFKNQKRTGDIIIVPFWRKL